MEQLVEVQPKFSSQVYGSQMLGKEVRRQTLGSFWVMQ